MTLNYVFWYWTKHTSCAVDFTEDFLTLIYPAVRWQTDKKFTTAWDQCITYSIREGGLYWCEENNMELGLSSEAVQCSLWRVFSRVSVWLGSIHRARLLKLRPYKITVAQRETSPDSGSRIRDCSWYRQSGAMGMLTQQFCFFSYESSPHWSGYVTVHSSQYCSLGNR